jgi:general secretion pathway protein J
MRRTSQAGFTLVELLVAMALLALLSALLLGGLRMSRAAVARGEIATERLLRAELGLAVLRRQLEQADPLPLDTTTEPRIAFAGDGQSVVFVAPPGAYLALGGEEITWLAIEPGTDGARIVLRYRPLDRAADVWPPTLDPRDMKTVVLLDGAARAEFSYFGRPSPVTDMQWQTAWRDAAMLPTLIRLSVAAWPDLIVTPRIGRPVGTGFLTGGALCRRGTPPPC